MNIPEGLRTQVADYVAMAQQLIRDYGDSMSEKETETWLVEPLLDILQWDTKTPSVRKGYSIKTEGKSYEADYALIVNSKPRILIEVKKVAYNLGEEHVTQLMKYAFYEKSDLFLLTNGDDWRAYEPYYMKDLIFTFNLESMESNLSTLWLLSRECVETDLLDWEIDRRYAIEKIYSYIEDKRDSWVNDIEHMSKTFTVESISKLLDKVIVDKKSVLGEQYSQKVPPPVGPPGGGDDKDEPWITNGKEWHLVHRLRSKSIEQPSEMAEHLLGVIKLVSSTLPHVTGPHWGQKYYVSFKADNTNWLWIGTGPSILDVYIKCDIDQFPLEDVSNRLGVCIFDTDATFSEKFSLPSSIQKEEDRGRMLLKIKPKFSMNEEEFAGLIEDAYRSFMELRDQRGESEPGEYTIEGKFSGAHAALRPIYDALESRIKELGEDIKVNVRKIHISFVRKYAFTVVYVLKDKIDIGMSLDPSVEDDRLRNANNWGWSRVNKAILISKEEDVDEQLIGWIRQSYDRS